MLLNLFQWTENADGSWDAAYRDTTIHMERVWDGRFRRYGWENFIHAPGSRDTAGGIADDADLNGAKREAERMANWHPGVADAQR